MTRKICVVTGTRADYGLLRLVIQGIRDAPDLRLQLIVTGTHFSPDFGSTYQEIERDGFVADAKVDMMIGADTPAGVARSMGTGLIGFGEAFDRLRPDVLVLLGDRFETLAAGAAALVARIPIAHLHGGESSEGAFDEAIRHALTKMAHLHFVAAEPYRRRVIQLGEDPARVFHVGGLGVDAVKRLKLLDRAALEAALDFQLGRRNLLVTFHPVTLEPATSACHMEELLAALVGLEDTHLIFTLPNADTDHRVLFNMIERFVAERATARAFASLGQLRYFSCVAQVDGVVGNSSSGITEVPSFGKGTVNIGDRQRGRLKAASVIDCEPDRAAISAAIARLYSPAFQSTALEARNPYGDGGASEAIVRILASYPLDGILKKSFYDLPQ